MFPTCTLPKATLAGFAPSVPTACPVPVSPRLTAARLLVNATLPVTLPAACGAKATVKLELCPGVSVKGVGSPLIENPAPAAVALVIVTELQPEFIIVTGWL